MKTYVIGLDYGSDSVRAVLIDTQNGAELATEVFWYPRWKQQKYCDASRNQFRQHPLDHIEGLEHTISSVVSQSGVAHESILSIAIDTTGSSPLPLTKNGTPLALMEEFSENPNAMMVLWKDHTAVQEAIEINELAKSWGGVDYTLYEGGVYSSEWFWAKILHIARADKAVKEAAHTWMEHCDYMTYFLCDNKNLTTFKRSRCAAGHKAMWHKSWGGLPDKAFLSQLNPYLADLRAHLYEETYTSDEVAGHLSDVWASKLGLTTKTVVAVGTFDAHAGAVGARIKKNTLVRVMGTSTCDIMVASAEAIGNHCVRGICGQVEGAVIPGMIGLEAGQSAFGDVLAWFKDLLAWPIHHLVLSSSVLSEEQKQKLQEEIDHNFIKTLTEQAKQIPIEEAIPVALDWVNGRRTPDANQKLKSALMGISLGTQAPHIFKALVGAICIGAKIIVDRFENEGVKIDTVIGIGGVARKSPYIMQTLANVLNIPIKVAESDQAPALGAAIYAAVAAQVYETVTEASHSMGSHFEAEYFPQPEAVKYYTNALQDYKALGEFVEQITQKKET